MEVAPGIHRIEAPLGDRYVSLYLLAGDDGLLLFDTGDDQAPPGTLAPYLAGLGRDPSAVGWIVTSHCDYDHFGGNRSALELFPRARLACHALDAAMAEDLDLLISGRLCEFAAHGIVESDETIATVRAGTRTAPVDLRLQGGEQVRLDRGWRVEIAHVPGHSRGHLCVLDERSRAAMVSDAVLGETLRTVAGNPAFPPTYRYVDTYLATIARLEAWRPRLLLTAHFPVFEGADVADFLGLSRAFTERLESGLRRLLAASLAPVPMLALIRELAPDLGEWSPDATLALSQPVAGHLERLERYGLAERTGDGEAGLAWRWKH
jgi:glyoxylase-like metal-dependent hydrolase (beta-lactamase superfamily II)